MQLEIRHLPRLPFVLLSILLLLAPLPVQSRDVHPPRYVAPPLRGPEENEWQPLDAAELPALRAQGGGLKAVAIVGDVGGSTGSFRNDMDVAVDVLQQKGVTVRRFYAGVHSFNWGDVVAAATDAHFLLYMGHGIWWSGPCQHPDLVGGFYFYDNQFVHPNQIRSDLAGRMDEDGVVILSHACFSAGNTACDGGGEPSQAEAARRVRMYAAPFVDSGMEAYFANNYYYSAGAIVNHLLAEPSTRKSVGGIFKSVYPFSASQFRDLSYPAAAGYDLWLSGTTGNWSDAFVGIPGYVFAGDVEPSELGPLPASLHFTYNTATEALVPGQRVLAPTNTASDVTLTWNVSKQGDWFSVSPSNGTAPGDRITITPNASAIASLPVGHYNGALTVSVTDPADTVNGVQRVDLKLDVVVPRLSGVPKRMGFTYFFSEGILLPESWRVTPENGGSDDALTWHVDQTGDWFTVSPETGSTPDTFTIVPDQMTYTEPTTFSGVITVTVTSPQGTEDAVQTIDASWQSRAGAPDYVYLPVVRR